MLPQKNPKVIIIRIDAKNILGQMQITVIQGFFEHSIRENRTFAT
jgi:hypothetical protein